MQQSKGTIERAQTGNVFIIILLGVVLFGALGFTFSRSANKGTGNLTKQQAKIAAQEILNYARLVEGAVDRVRRKGCSESEISFDNDVVSGYTNSNAPGDNSCHIFDDNGGKTTYSKPNTKWLDANFSAQSLYEELFFPARVCIPFLGEDTGPCNTDGLNNEDLLIIFPYIKENICAEINAHLHNNRFIPQDVAVMWPIGDDKFTGSFSDGAGLSDNPTNTNLGKESYCLEGGGNTPVGSYVFYHTLLARG